MASPQNPFNSIHKFELLDGDNDLFGDGSPGEHECDGANRSWGFGCAAAWPLTVRAERQGRVRRVAVLIPWAEGDGGNVGRKLKRRPIDYS
jgi:hypothetical protein